MSNHPNRSKTLSPGMYAIQKKSNDSGWRNIYSYPLGAEDAILELSQQRRWARDDKSGIRYRAIRVYL